MVNDILLTGGLRTSYNKIEADSLDINRTAFTYDNQSMDKDQNSPIMVNFSSISKPSEPADSVLQRYRNVLEMLRNEVLNIDDNAGNIEFMDGSEDDLGAEFSMESDNNHLPDLIKVEKERCSKSTFFLKCLLQNSSSVPLAILEAILSDPEIIEKLLSCNDPFTFGLKRDLPEGIGQSILKSVAVATDFFNGSCIPLVMWPFCYSEGSVNNFEIAKVHESVVFDALQIYRLRKHNRRIYLEVGRSNTLSYGEGGALAVDTSDSVILREISDTILDEILSALWCLSFLSVHSSGFVPSNIKCYADAILAKGERLIEFLWERYISFSAHLKLRCSYLKNVDKALDERFISRMIVEVHRMIVLQTSIIHTITCLHMARRDMGLSEFYRYLTFLDPENFSGVFSVACNVLGLGVCSSSSIFMHAIHELQTASTLLLSSFYLLGCSSVDKKSVLHDSTFDKVHSKYMIPKLENLEFTGPIDELGSLENKSMPILLFAYCSFLCKLAKCSQEGDQIVFFSDSSNSFQYDSQSFIKRAGRLLEKYSNCLEWMCSSRELFVKSFDPDKIVTFTARMILVNSFVQLLSAFKVSEIPRLDKITHAMTNVVYNDDKNIFIRIFRCGKPSALQRLCNYLMGQFPYGINILFQILSVLLPGSSVMASTLDSGDNDDEDSESMKLIVNVLLSPFKRMSVSPVTVSVDLCGSTNKFETNEPICIEIQLLAMLGLNRSVISENWDDWKLGSCLYHIPKGSEGCCVYMDSLSLTMLKSQLYALMEKQQDLWLADTDMAVLTPLNYHSNNATDIGHHNTSQNDKEIDNRRIWSIQFTLENSLSVSVIHKCEKIIQKSVLEPDGAVKFTLLRSLWVIWKGCISYLSHLSCDLPATALQTFVSCNTLLTRLLIKFPSLAALIESHILSTMYITLDGFDHRHPFGPCNVIFHYVMLFVIALKRPQLRIILPEVIEALRSFLQPLFVVSVGEDLAQVMFDRYWIVFRSLQYCLEFQTMDEQGLNMFDLLSRIMQEEERNLYIYPVSTGILKFFKEFLVRCPPELWMLNSCHHGKFNISCASLEVESKNLSRGMSVSYLRILKGYTDEQYYQSCELYSPFQSFLLCEMFSFVLKTAGMVINELEFANVGQMLEMILEVLEIVRLTCRIFKVSNYDNLKWKIPKDMQEDSGESWMRGLNELVNRILLILSDSNYINEIAKFLTYQLDLVHNSWGSMEGSLVMVSPLLYSESSSSFFTAKTMQYRRMGLAMLVSSKAAKNQTIQCQLNSKFRWLSNHEHGGDGSCSSTIVNATLKCLRELLSVALPKNRNLLFTTLTKTLGGSFFSGPRAAMELRRRYLMPSEHLQDLNDPVIYFSIHQLHLLCSKLPQISIAHSIIAHTYCAQNISLATDVMSMYLILREQCYLNGMIVSTDIGSEKILLQQLGVLKGHCGVLAMANKKYANFHEHLMYVFMDSKLSGYRERISILQYFIVSMGTWAGMELLKHSNNTLNLVSISGFVDSILRFYVLRDETRSHNLCDLTICQLALVVFNKLVSILSSKQKHCWKTVNLVLRVLVNLWRSYDSSSIFNATGLHDDAVAVLHPTMLTKIHKQEPLDYHVCLSKSLPERRIALLRIIGSVCAILNSISYKLRSVESVADCEGDFMDLLSFVSMNWDFMDMLFPVVVYDSGFIDKCVKASKQVYTGTKNRNLKFYRLGLWIGDDSMVPLSRCLHLLSDFKIPQHNLFMHEIACNGIEPLNIQLLMSQLERTVSSFSGKNKSENDLGGAFCHDKLGHETYLAFIKDITGPPEFNAINGYLLHKKSDKGEFMGGREGSFQSDCKIFNFKNAEEYGYNYLMDSRKFYHRFIMLLLSSYDDGGVSVPLLHSLNELRRCKKMVSYVESLKDLKIVLLQKLCQLVDLFRSKNKILIPIISKSIEPCKNSSYVGVDVGNTKMRMVGYALEPFEMFTFNATMLVQLALTHPDCLEEHPVYIGLLLMFLELVLTKNVSLQRRESAFIRYYDCSNKSDGLKNCKEGLINYIVNDDRLNEERIVDREFRLFAVNVFGGLVAQVVRYIVDFADSFKKILDVDFKLLSRHRKSSRVRIAALESCLMYHSSSISDGKNLLSDDSKDIFVGLSNKNTLLSFGDGKVMRECVCGIASGRGAQIDDLSVWLQYKMTLFFAHLYKSFSKITQCALEISPSNDEILDVYKKITNYAIVNLSQYCHTITNLIRYENDNLLHSFVDFRHFLEICSFESPFVFCLGPYTAIYALETVISLPFNKKLLENCGYQYVMLAVDSLMSLPYSASVCVSSLSKDNFDDSSSENVLLDLKENFLVESVRMSPGKVLKYENYNWLRAIYFKCLEKLNSVMISGSSHKGFINRIVDMQFIPRIYLYSYLSKFVRPLYYVNPRTMLAEHCPSAMECTDNGNCVGMLENYIAIWYPCYISHIFDENPVRCPYHQLHCGLLYFIISVLREDNIDGSKFAFLILQLLKMRIQHIFQQQELTMAYLEEAYLYFSLTRNLPDWRSASKEDLELIKEIIKWSISYFNNLTELFRTGLNKFSDFVPPVSTPEHGFQCTNTRSSGLFENKNKQSDDKNSKGTGTPPSKSKYVIYRQRGLYLILKSIESFLTLLLNLKLTLEYDAEFPPALDKFVKPQETTRGAIAITREQFQAVLSSADGIDPATIGINVECKETLDTVDYCEITIALISEAFYSSTELGGLSLRIWRELKSNRGVFFHGYSGENMTNFYIPLSLNIVGVDGTEVMDFCGIKCAVCNQRVDVASNSTKMDILPLKVDFIEFKSIFECIVEKSIFFGAQIVNAMFLQNQLGQVEKIITVGNKKVSNTRKFNSTVTLLVSLFSDIRKNPSLLGKSTNDFVHVMNALVAKRLLQSKLLFKTFKDSLIYLA